MGRASHQAQRCGFSPVVMKEQRMRTIPSGLTRAPSLTLYVALAPPTPNPSLALSHLLL